MTNPTDFDSKILPLRGEFNAAFKKEALGPIGVLFSGEITLC